MLVKLAICTTIVVCHFSGSRAASATHDKPSGELYSDMRWEPTGSMGTEILKRNSKPHQWILNDEQMNAIATCRGTLNKLGISNDHRILIVGESSFTLSKILAEALYTHRFKTEEFMNDPNPARNFSKVFDHRNYCNYVRPAGANFVATSYTQGGFAKDYGSDETFRVRTSNIKVIEDHMLGEVIRGVDATKLQETIPKQKVFDRVIWTFPYNPDADRINSPGLSRHERYQKHGQLVQNFFRSVAPFLSPNGEVHVLLNNKLYRGKGQYGCWHLERRLKKKDWTKFHKVREERIEFLDNGLCRDIPGYFATKTDGTRWNKKMGMVNPTMYVFKRISDEPKKRPKNPMSDLEQVVS